MRTSFLASALLLVASAVNAAPVANAEPQFEVEVIIERDADLPVHLIEKRQVIVTVTRTAHEQQIQRGQRTRTITRTIRRTRAQTSFTPIATPDITPAEVFATPDTTPTPVNTPVQQQAKVQAKTTSTPSSDTTSSSAVGPDANAQSALDSHNKYRALHGVGALTWDDTLASYAAQHAAGCVFQHTGGTSSTLFQCNV
jgi:uncharacterized protein YkwD